MPTLVFATGFAHQVATVGAAATGGAPIWDYVIGGVSIDTTTKRTTATASLKILPAASTAMVRTTYAIAAHAVGVVYVNFSSLPTGAAAAIITLGAGIIGVDTAGKWYAEVSGGTIVTDTIGPSINTWYRIDLKTNLSANPWTLDWKIDGSAKTQATYASAPGGSESLYLGVTDAGVTCTYYLCDVAFSLTAADYPIGNIYIKSYQPNADGTHVTPSNFEDAGNVAISGGNPAYDQMDAVPISSLTEYVTQLAISTGNYVEVGFANSSEGKDPIHVQVSLAMSADSATGNNATYLVRDGSTDLNVFSGDPSQITNIYRTLAMATKPSGGAWTEAALNALLFRFGFSSDATPDPRCGGVIAEAVFAESGTTFYQSHTAGNAAFAGGLIRRPGKTLGAGLASLAAGIIKRTSRSFTGG